MTFVPGGVVAVVVHSHLATRTTNTSNVRSLNNYAEINAAQQTVLLSNR